MRPIALRATSALLLPVLAPAALADFTNPYAPPFRGAPNTELAGWVCFTEPDGGANLPDVAGTTADDAVIRQLVPGAIVTSTCNIYHPGAPSSFVLEDSVPRDLVEVFLQIRAVGTPLDLASPELTYVDGNGQDVVVPFAEHVSLAAGEDLFRFDLAGETEEVLAYAITWQASGAHMSLDAVLLDTRFDEVGATYCAAEPNSTGVGATLVGLGSHAVADDDLMFRAADLPANRNGYLLNAPMQGFVANPGGSQGDLCLGGAIGRHTKSIGDSGATGVIEVVVDLDALPRPSGGAHVVLPGETWNFQVWYRDSNPTPTSNFTEAVTVTFR